MGKFGIGIMANDTAMDCEGIYLEMYDQGIDPAIIRKEVQKQLATGIGVEQNTEFWLSLAFVQWHIGHVDEDVKVIVWHIVDNDIDLDLWRKMKITKKEVAYRAKLLRELKFRLQFENENPRQPGDDTYEMYPESYYE
ncbi:MAG: hypothetical protein NTU44_15580 [Bacteroidetes bacterium]|nr:hypothetical protein [Bacteroidota bacterium]